MKEIAGLLAFVTGAASGIGLGIAEALVAEGARVVLADRDAAELDRQAQRLGPEVHGVVLDVTDRPAWTRARSAAEEWGAGPVDILVNNAGIGPALRPLVEITPESFDLLVRIKVDGTFNGIHTFAPGMRERRRGHVVNTASMAGLSIQPRLGDYTTAMFGVVGMSEVLRWELAPFDVGVSVLCPGLVRTRLGETTRAVRGEPPRGPESRASSQEDLRHRSVVEPREVGDLVVAAIRADDLYVITHGEFRDVVEQRSRRLLDAFERAPRRE